MSNWELGIAVSSAAVSFDRGKNSSPLPSPPAAVTRLCGEIVVALSPPLSLLLYILPFPPTRGKEPVLFFQGVRV